MTAIAPGLTVRDSQILELLRGGATPQRVVEVGAYRATWTSEHVQQVIERHADLITGPTPRTARPTPRTARPRTRRPREASTWQPPTFDVTDPPAVNLTLMQGEVLTCICLGLSNKAIAAQLHVTEDTVKTHAKGVLAALHADDRLHAAVLALTGQVRVTIRNQHRRTT